MPDAAAAQASPVTALDNGATAPEAAQAPAAAPDKLAGARAITAKRVAEQRALAQAKQGQAATHQQLQTERQARAAAESKAAELEKRLADADMDPVERWMRKGLTVEQARAELAKLDDPVSKELAAIRKEREEEKAAAAKAKQDAEELQTRMTLAQRNAQAEREFVALVETSPGKFPHLEVIYPGELVAMGRSLLDQTAAEKSRRSGPPGSPGHRPYQECRADPYTDEQILLGLNARIEERMAARKAKAKPVEQETAPVAGSAPGQKSVQTASRTTPEQKKAAVTNPNAIDWDKLSDKQQWELMGEMVRKSGAYKPKPAKR
jgi:hypothetical protein